MSSLLALVALVRWLHLTAAVALFGAALFPLYAPTGRFIDRPLRAVVRVAAFGALLTAVAETAAAPRGLTRIALLAFACLVGVSLRRNSWTVRTQARVLAAVAGLALASVPSSDLDGGGGMVATALRAAALLAAGAWLGALAPLGLVAARATDGAEAAATAANALRHSFPVAIVAAAVLLSAGVSHVFLRTGSPLPASLRVLQAGLFAVLAGLAALDRFALGPRSSMDRSAAAALATSIRLQCVVAFAFLATIAHAWTLSAAH